MALGISERLARMNSINSALGITPTQPENNLNDNPSTFQDVNTNIDISGLNDINTDLSGISNRLNEKVDVTTDTSMTADQLNRVNNVSTAKQDIENFNSNITPDMLAQQRGLRSQSQLDMEKRLNQGLDSLQDYSSGNSKVDRTIANATLGRFDASSAAANLSQAQKIASNPYLSEGAKNVASAELARTTASQRAQLSGELAKESQLRAYTASEKYADLALKASEYEETKFNDDMTNINKGLDRNLAQLIAVGDLSIADANNAVTEWSTNVRAKLDDAARSIDALVAIGDIKQTEANLIYNKQKAIIDTQVQKAQLDLEKLRGIQDNKMIDAQIQNLENQNIGIWAEREANAIIDWKTANQRDDGTYSVTDDVNAIKDDPAAMAAITQSYQTLMKNPSAIPTDEYILAKLKAIPTPQEASLQSITNKLSQLKTSLVGTGPGQISADLWPEVESYFKTLALTEGAMKINSDGTVSVLGADGSEMMNIGGYTSDSLKANYGDAFYEVNMNDIYNGISESEFVKRLTDPNSSLFQSGFTTNKEPLSKSEATSLYRALKSEVKTTTNTSDNNTEKLTKTWEDNWAKVQEDPRFDDLGETATATLFYKSGATNFDDFSKWLEKRNKYGIEKPINSSVSSTTTTPTVQKSEYSFNNGTITDSSGNVINKSDYSKVFQNAYDPDSPTHEMFLSILKNPDYKSTISINNTGSKFTNLPQKGELIVIGDTLYQFEKVERRGGNLTGEDTIYLKEMNSGVTESYSSKRTHSKYFFEKGNQKRLAGNLDTAIKSYEEQKALGKS